MRREVDDADADAGLIRIGVIESIVHSWFPALMALVQAFDVDILSGQSYALLPISAGSAKDFATSMTDALRAGTGASLANVVRVVPMDRINAVLVVSRVTVPFGQMLT